MHAALKPLAIGADPLQPEVLWHRMYHYTRDYGMKGAVIGAISGVDIALWDIAGKVRGEPCAKLLGGMFRDRVQAYATGFYRITGRGEAPRLAAEAVEKLEAGFRALKVKLGFGLDDDLAVHARDQRRDRRPRVRGDDRHQPRLRRRRGDRASAAASRTWAGSSAGTRSR